MGVRLTNGCLRQVRRWVARFVPPEKHIVAYLSLINAVRTEVAAQRADAAEVAAGLLGQASSAGRFPPSVN